MAASHDIALLTALAESDGALAESARRILAALDVSTDAADTDDTPTKKAAPTKKRTQSTKAAPKGTAARRKKGEKAEEWIVRESWKGEQASTRMLGFAVKCGVSAAILKKGDKYAVSHACGTALKLPVVIRD